MQHAKIILKGDYKNTGFGFSCMQQALHLNINGTFTYLHPNTVEIIACGNNNELKNYYKWCLKQPLTQSGEIELYNNQSSIFSEFEIINQL